MLKLRNFISFLFILLIVFLIMAPAPSARDVDTIVPGVTGIIDLTADKFTIAAPANSAEVLFSNYEYDILSETEYMLPGQAYNKLDKVAGHRSHKSYYRGVVRTDIYKFPCPGCPDHRESLLL